MGGLGALGGIIFTYYKHAEWVKTRDLTGQIFDSHLTIEGLRTRVA